MKIYKEINKSIGELVKARGGYCPCATIKNDDTKCICKEFRETAEGVCHCGRYETYSADTITCKSREDAEEVADNIGWGSVTDWEYLPDGKVRLIIRGKLSEIGQQVSRELPADEKARRYDMIAEVIKDSDPYHDNRSACNRIRKIINR